MKSNIKWLGKYLSIVKGMLILSTLLMIAESYAFLATIGLQQTLIDDVLIAGNYDGFKHVLLLIITAFRLCVFIYVWTTYNT
jgi:ABC-type multidrug transport system fused ATPase/permease subunit